MKITPNIIYKGFLHIIIVVHLYLIYRSTVLGDDGLWIYLIFGAYFVWKLGAIEYVESKAKKEGISVEEYLRREKEKK